MVQDTAVTPGHKATGMTRGGGGMVGVVGGHRGRGGHSGGDGGPEGVRQRGNEGLNPHRQRGFNWQTRIVTPTLNDMKAKQGAVVSKFMTFMNRKNSVMIELYEKSFYTKKPGWDSLANFVYSDLCPTDVLRAGIEDVQYHPVKMIIFIKFKAENIRDQVHASLQAGVFWTEYGVTVRGHSLDANVRFIRILGVSPETTADDIKNTFSEVGIGEVVDLRKGLLDPKRLPGVTNGTWMVRVKIHDADKNIPPYIIRREEGELWSLNFDGRRFVCWKCGSPDHIGDKCKDQERTFEEVFGDNTEGTAAAEQSWAAVVKGNSGLDHAARAKRDAIAKQIKEKNEVKNREKKELEEKRIAEAEEKERRRLDEENARIEALEVGRVKGQQARTGDDELEDSLDELLVSDKNTEPILGVGGDSSGGGGNQEQVPRLPPLGRRVPNPRDPRIRTSREEDDPGGGCSDSAEGTRKLVIDRIDPALIGLRDEGCIQLDNSFERIFGAGSTRLAIEFEGLSKLESVHNIVENSNDVENDSKLVASTPKKRFREEKEDFGNLSNISEGNVSGDESELELDECEAKKQKVEGSEQPDVREVTDDDMVRVEAQQSGGHAQIEVAPDDPAEVQAHVVDGTQQDSSGTC